MEIMETNKRLMSIAALASLTATIHNSPAMVGTSLNSNVIQPETYSPFYKPKEVYRSGNNKPNNIVKNRRKEKLASRVRRKQAKGKKK